MGFAPFHACLHKLCAEYIQPPVRRRNWMFMKQYKRILMRLIPIVIVIALTVVLSEVFYRNLMKKTTDGCWNEMATAHREISREIDTRFQTNLSMLNLASDAIMMNADLNDHETVLAYLAGVQEVTIYDRIDVIFPSKQGEANGTILVQNGTADGLVMEDAGSVSFDELVALGSHMSTRVADFFDPTREVIHFFSPVYDENEQPIAILGATLYCSTVKTLFSSAHYGEHAQLFLVDRRDGKLVMDARGGTPGSIYDMQGYTPPEDSAVKDPIADMLAGNTGTMSYTSQSNNMTAYTYYASVNDVFTLITIVQEDVVFAELNALRVTLMWVGVIEVGLLVLLIIWIYNMIRRSVEYAGRAGDAELELLRKKEQELQHQYKDADARRQFMETLAVNLPGGYHRCTIDHEFRLTFASKSFTETTGYTLEQMNDELGGSYMGIVAPEDKDKFMALAPQLERDGYIHCAYRIRRRDGEIRWVQDSTQYVERDGERYYQCALSDITDHVEELEQARRQAEASNLAKSTFLFNISHDIRTPMNAIKGFAGMIKDHVDDAAMVQATITKIEQASNTLMTLMNDVLDLARIERGKEKINLEPTQIQEQYQGLVEMFSSEMSRAGIHFVQEQDVRHTHVLCDPLKLMRIGMNMLSNAKKFTPHGGTVTFGLQEVSCDGATATYRLCVRDTGVGKSRDFLKRAFEQFERERTSTQSGVTGSGLGLAIIKTYVELMGGTVSIESELGRGTQICAVLSFTLIQEEETAVQMTDALPFSAKGCRALLVEDNAFNREIASYMLQGLQFTVEEAENGAVCLDMLRAADAGYYSVILMDVQMPVMDGYTATAEIRRLSDRQKAGIPILAMTANAFEEDKRKCLEVGMNGHIGKPIDTDALIRELSVICHSRPSAT